jgi:hypothetical protein
MERVLRAAGLALGAFAAIAAPWLPSLPWPESAAVAHAAGVSHDGEPLRASHPLRRLPTAASSAAAAALLPVAQGLDLRQNCLWGQPGRKPYRGTPEQALRAAGLPPEVVARLAADIRGKHLRERLVIANDGIRSGDGRLQYAAAPFVMTYGTSLCLGSRVNFAPGHTEPASLYTAFDRTGREHAVMVPDVCGNVSVLQASQTATEAGHEAFDPRSAGLTHADAWPRGDGTPRAVPAPATLPLVGLGLLLVWLSRRR